MTRFIDHLSSIIFHRASFAVLRRAAVLPVVVLLIAGSTHALLAQSATIEGAVVDQLGGGVAGATVVLTRDGQKVAEAKTDATGAFTLAAPGAGRYGLEASAAGFLPRVLDAFFVGAGARVPVSVALSIGINQAVVVTASADTAPASQAAASVTVIERDVLDALGKPDVSEALRLVPGAQVVAAGARGNVTSLFVRGGSSAFNKVLVDGVAVNDIGGVFDFADVDTTGVERIEVLRNANSVLHGNDALTGVVAISTARGRTRTPEAKYSIDGGTLGTARHDMSIGGATNRVDYFAGFSHFSTDNDVPNNKYSRDSFAARVGLAVGASTDVSAVFRAGKGESGLPNATLFYVTPDDSTRTTTSKLFSLSADSRISSRLKTSVRYAVVTSDYDTTNPSPTGEYYDPFGFGGNYLGKEVTITGANGYSVKGQAILDYGQPYPSPFTSAMTRQFVSGQATYRLRPSWSVSAGARIEHEEGSSLFGTNEDDTDETSRTNTGAFVELQGAAGPVSVSGGLGFDDNAVYGFAVTPRISVATYLRKPSASGSVGETRLFVNAGSGIKAPTLSQELQSLYGLVLSSVPGVDPIAPEKSRGFDVGVEQALARGRVRLRAAYFNNSFTNLIEFVSKSVLTQLGVSAEAAAATAFGAYVNSQSYDAEGIEVSSDVAIGPVTVMASYMYLGAEVTKSFSGGVLAPAENPAFPGIKIGQYAPLVGGRPFRRPANSGSLLVRYNRGPFQAAVSGYFSGVQDDSTFLSDPFFGYSMLLPNKDLGAAFQKLDLGASYAIHPRARWYLSVENLLNQEYQPASGYPALPATFRTGITLSVGGN